MTDEKNNLTPNEQQDLNSAQTPQQNDAREPQESQGQNDPFNAPPIGSFSGDPRSGSSAGQSSTGFTYGNSYYGAPMPPKKPKKRLGAWIVALGVLYLILIGGLFAMISTGALKFAASETAQEEVQKGTEEKGTGEKQQNAPIVENPSTDGNQVIVREDYTGKTLTASELYEQNVESVVFVTANYRQGTATGSGFVIDSENGYLLTNYHVVENCEDIAVTLKNGDSYTAKFIGGDAINDVAVLKVDAKGLRHVTIANSDNLKVGEDVLIIGNPLGDLTFTLTKGIVSAVDRTINTGEYNIKTFQTDTAINSGNSGGPAFDATGAVIGIASAKYASTGIEGIGFCIPINDAMAIAKDLVAYGYVKGRPNFGIAVSDSLGYEYSTDEFGRRVLVETTKGAKVEQVGKKSCAAAAGLQEGDIITKLGDTKITNATQLINAKNGYKAGDTVTIEVYRKGETITLTVTLDEYSPEES